MTKNEFKKRMNDYESQITNIEKKIKDLKIEYMKDAPFKIGDKVIVEKYGKGLECFIGAVKVSWSYDYEYLFVKVKKDGTMSEQSAGVYYPEKIEKIS